MYVHIKAANKKLEDIFVQIALDSLYANEKEEVVAATNRIWLMQNSVILLG